MKCTGTEGVRRVVDRVEGKNDGTGMSEGL